MKAAAAEIFMALLVIIIFSLSLGGTFSSLNANIFKEYSETLKESMIINSSYNIEFAKMGLQHALKYSLHAAIMQPINDQSYYTDYWYYFEPVLPIAVLDTKFFLENWTTYFFNPYAKELAEFYNLNIPRVKSPKLFSEAVPQPFDIGNETCKNIGGTWISEFRICDLANVACDEEACIHAGGVWDEGYENCLALGRAECEAAGGTWWERYKICVCGNITGISELSLFTLPAFILRHSNLIKADSFYNSTTGRCEPITNETCKLFGGEWVNITFPFSQTYCNFPGEVFVSGGIKEFPFFFPSGREAFIDVVNARIGAKNKISKSSQAINIFDSLNLSSGTVNTYLLSAILQGKDIVRNEISGSFPFWDLSCGPEPPGSLKIIAERAKQITSEELCKKVSKETDCDEGCTCKVLAPEQCIAEIEKNISSYLGTKTWRVYPLCSSYCAGSAPFGDPLSVEISAKPIISYSASCTATCQNCNTTSGTAGKKTNITCYFSNWQIALQLDVNIFTAASHPIGDEFKNLNLNFKLIDGDKGALNPPKISLTCEGKNFFSATERKCEKLARFGYNCEWNSTYNLCSCPGGNPC
jgi:DNA-binding CsgD family transcriptional regulator